MSIVYGFRTEEEAVRYADKNFYKDTYSIYETRTGTYAIDKQEGKGR